MRTGWMRMLVAAIGLLAWRGALAGTIPVKPAADVPTLIRTGKEFYQQAKLKEALERFDEAIRAQPGNLVANQYAARIHAQLGDFREAIDLIRKLQQHGISIYRSEDSRRTLELTMVGTVRVPDLKERGDLLVHLRETVNGLSLEDERVIDAHLMAIYAKTGENHLHDVVKGRYFAIKPPPPGALFTLGRTYLEYDVNLGEATAYFEQAIDSLKGQKLPASGNPETDKTLKRRVDAQINASEDFLAYTYAVTKQFGPERNRFVAAEPEVKAKFAEVTEAAGLKGVVGPRVAVGDFDNDGFEDLAVGGRLFKNYGGKTFSEVTPGSRIDKRYVVGSIWLDYDNDGNLDLLCASFPTLRLWRNLGGGVFEDVTEAAGLGLPLPGLPECLAATDYDGDGYLDVFVGCGENPEKPGVPQPPVLFRGGRGGTFQDVSEKAGIRGKENFYTRACAWGDFNNDGRPDLYVGNGRYNPNVSRLGLYPNQLWVNRGDGTFADQAEARGVRGVEAEGRFAGSFGETSGCAWGDFDNNGTLGLLVSRLAQVTTQSLDFADPSALYVNGGQGSGWPFTDVLPGSGIRFEEMVVGASLCDYDNDGALDVFFTCMYKERPTFLYRNVGDNKFRAVTWRAGVLAFNTSGQAWLDLDNDGDMDLVLGSLAGVRLFENRAQDTSWLRVQLVGTRSNRQGLGSRITVAAGPLTLLREVTCGYGSFCQSSPIAHFGLGSHKGPVQITVRWPDGHTQALTVDKANQLVKVVEK